MKLLNICKYLFVGYLCWGMVLAYGETPEQQKRVEDMRKKQKECNSKAPSDQICFIVINATNKKLQINVSSEWTSARGVALSRWAGNKEQPWIVDGELSPGGVSYGGFAKYTENGVLTNRWLILARDYGNFKLEADEYCEIDYEDLERAKAGGHVAYVVLGKRSDGPYEYVIDLPSGGGCKGDFTLTPE